MKLLVHLHVFYHDQVPWFLERLRSLDGYDWDLIVTFCEADAAMEKRYADLHAENGGKHMNHLYTRVSIRKYQDRPVEKEKTEAMLRAAM